MTVSAQNIVTVSGNVAYDNGDPIEGLSLVALFLENDTLDLYTETDVNGDYSLSLDLGADSPVQGCFEIFAFDCDGSALLGTGCYSPENYDFIIDFVYCENGTDQCSTVIFVNIPDSFYVTLSTFDFGVSPFTYSWSNGSTDAEIIVPSDSEGDFCVTVTDAQGCVADWCINLDPPDECFVFIYEEYTYNSVLLYAEGYGQSEDLSYDWSTGENTTNIEVFESGEYCVTITDVTGCEAFDCRYIEVDSSTWEECFAYIYSDGNGDSLEVLSVEAFGVAPFTYLWSLDDVVLSTSESITVDVQGVYCVVVTDSEGCEFETCYDYFIWSECGVWLGCDPFFGSVQLVAFAYGAEPIEYTWSTGDTGPEIVVTESGEYCVSIVDGEGCESSICMNVNVEEVAECFSPIEVDYYEEAADLTVNPVGEGNFTYLWNTGETTQTITIQGNGDYCVEVVDLDSDCAFTTCTTVWLNNIPDCFADIEVVTEDDSSAVLTVYPVSQNDSTQYYYIWSTGDSTSSITVFEEGEYCVTISDYELCEFTVCTYFTYEDLPWNEGLFVAYYDESTGEGLSGVIELYTVFDNETIEFYDVVDQSAIFGQGIYYADIVDEGSYIALAIPSDGESFVPSYSYSTTFWDEANVFSVGPNSPLQAVEIVAVHITDIDGLGSIEGVVTDDQLVAETKDNEFRNGDPVADANVMLMHNDIPVGQQFTKEDGYYKFENLPYGTYTVILEIPGKIRQEVIVTISEEAPNATGVEFETDISTTSTSELESISNLTLSPNPTSDKLIIESTFDNTQNVNLKIADATGKLISDMGYKMNVGTNTIQLDVAEYENGIYFLTIQSEDKLTTKRFIKL